MDLADMILDRAKELEINEFLKEVITYEILFHVHDAHENRCKDIPYSFTIKPVKYSKLVVIEYNGMRWKLSKRSTDMRFILMSIFRQIIKTFMTDHKIGTLEDQYIHFQVSYRGGVVFTDSYVITMEVDLLELSTIYIEDCDGNEELRELQKIFENLTQLMLSCDFNV
jgi:hypothetical protein